jgi:hypothetical protein
MILYLCVLIVLSLRRESLKLILLDKPLPEVVLSQPVCKSHSQCPLNITARLRLKMLPNRNPGSHLNHCGRPNKNETTGSILRLYLF